MFVSGLVLPCLSTWQEMADISVSFGAGAPYLTAHQREESAVM